MLQTFLKSKIHRATVTESNIDYAGSLTIDSALMELADIKEFEQVHVLNLKNGERLITYAISGKKNQQATINHIIENFDEYKEYLEKLLREN